jgi:Zn-finger nucleic acid-binding protein
VYRDSFVSCPACGVALGTDGGGDAMKTCEGCGGAWVPEAIVAEMVRTMTYNAELAPAFKASTEKINRKCPACSRELVHGWLEFVPVERCEKGHGYWFDKAELETVLHRAGTRTS